MQKNENRIRVKIEKYKRKKGCIPLTKMNSNELKTNT